MSLNSITSVKALASSESFGLPNLNLSRLNLRELLPPKFGLTLIIFFRHQFYRQPSLVPEND